MSGKTDILIIDSGYSEAIKKYDKSPIDGDPLWMSKLIVSNPQALIQTQVDILRVGVDFLRTMTYQSSIDGYCKSFGYTKEQSFEVMKRSVNQIKEAWNIYSKTNPNAKRPIFNGSIGSYGAYLHDGSDYTGSYKDSVTAQHLQEFHQSRFDALLAGGSDHIVFETIPCLKEAKVLISMLKTEPHIKGWLSFSCRDDGTSIASGENFQECATICYDMCPEQLLGIGVNCLQPRLVESLFRGINDSRKNAIPLIVYPGSGEIYTKEKGYVGKGECAPIESYVSLWLDLGVKIIGACCQTSIEDLQKIKVEVKKWQERQ